MRVTRVWAVALALGLSSPAWAQLDLHRMEERLDAARERLLDGASPDELRSLRTEMRALRAAFGARFERLERSLDEVESRIDALLPGALGPLASERLARARAALESSHVPLLEGLERLEARPDPFEIEECLRRLGPIALASREDILGTQELPLRAPELSPQPLQKSGIADTESFSASGAPDAPVIGSVPESLRRVAEGLDGAVAVYELVKNETRFELYSGFMKGAEQTFLEGRGNDADINALLVSLLRAKGIPARFVRGVVRLPIDRAMNLLGVERADRVEQALFAAAVPYEPVFSGTGLTAIELERVWAEAYLPYSNYRGTALDDQGLAWVPLDASFKLHTLEEGVPVLQDMGFDADAFLREAFRADPLFDPLAEIRRRVEEHLAVHEPGTSFEDALRKSSAIPEVYGILPARLPYEVISVNGVSFDPPSELGHAVRFRAVSGAGQLFLDARFASSRLLGRRLTLSYTPATPDDQRTADAFGGLYQTPPFLVEVRPVVRSGGLVVASGSAIGMGLPFDFRVSFESPGGAVDFENRMIAGAFAAMALSGRGPTFEESSETRAGEILSQRALRYLARWNDADDELAGLARVVNLRPIPSHVMVKNRIQVEYAEGEELVPIEFLWKGIDVDSDLRPSAPIAAEDDDSARRTFLLLSGLVGSELESRVLEDDLGVASISTSKLLRLAGTLGVELREIDSSNVDVELPGLAIEPALEEAIASHVHQGRVVTAPAADVAFLAWRGAGFVSLDPETGESAYMLSGAIAGGSSAVNPEEYADEVEIALRDPEESKDVPSRLVARIAKFAASDFQEGVVTTELERPLEVWVTDEDGNPVEDGVPVLFRVLEPGLDAIVSSMDTSAQGEAVVVATEGGRARVRFRLGKTTRFRPRFTFANEGDRFMTQVGVYSVTAESGGVSLVNPFLAFALPDRAGGVNELRHRGGAHATNQPLIVDANRLAAEILDRFDNPLSNVTVTYRVGPASRLDDAPLPEENFVNAKLLTDDGQELDQVFSTGGPYGVGGFVRLGNTDFTRFTVTAELEGKTIEFQRDSRDFGTRLVTWPVGERPSVIFGSRGIDLPSGKRLWLGRAGERLPGSIEFNLFAFQEDYKVVRNENTGRYELEGKGTFSRRPVNEATVTPVLLEGTGAFEPTEYRDAFDGVYVFQLFLGKEPGRRRIGRQVDAKLFRPVVDPNTGDVTLAEFRDKFGPGETGHEVWGAAVRLLEQVPNPIFVDGNGHVEAAASLPYEILPAEVDAMLQSRVQGRVIRIYEENALYAENDLPPVRVDVSPNIFFDTAKVYEAEIVLLKDTFFELRSERNKIRFFTASLDRSDPRPIFVRRRVVNGPFLADPSTFQYYVEPSPVSWDEVRVSIVAVDRQTSLESILVQLPGTTVEGSGEAVLPASANVPVDLEGKEYRAELLLRQGAQIRKGTPLFNPFARLLYDVSPKVSVGLEVASGEPCIRPGVLVYRLSQPAEVLITATFGREERVLFRGVRDPATVAPDPLVFILSDPTVLPLQDGKYPLRIHARAVNEELEEEFVAELTVKANLFNVLPVGHTFVKGVDLLDGHVVASSTDVSIPGRGPALELVRTYGSSGSSDEGPLGAGWTMNYFSTLVVTGCSWTVRGGDGSGQRFTQEGGRFVPQKGYHTELVENTDGSFDFFTKGRVRYHYVDRRLHEDAPAFSGQPTLAFIEDTNGNRIELLYDSERNIVEAREVFAGGVVGRSLHFTYENVRGVPRLSTVTGPLGLSVRYEYDAFANLVRVTRDERVESYEYTTGHPIDKHNLVAYTDPNGNTTRYEYFGDTELFEGEILDPLSPPQKFEWVKKVREQEGVETAFAYDISEANDGRLITTVTDGRGHDTVYTLNLNGSPLRIEEPLGVVTEMEWSLTDIFKTREIDANLRITDFEYDGNGNLLRETVRAGGDLGDVVTEFDYHPVFNKMTLKRDAEGRETRFAVNDANGNLDSVTDAEGKLTEYQYAENGDLLLVIGPRPGQQTSFTYDAFGNPATATDGEGNITTTVYDERSRLVSSSDTLGRSMTQAFDELDRVTSVTRTDASGASDEEVILRDYYPGGQLQVETNGLGLATSFFLDGLNRVVGTSDTLGFTTTTQYDPNGNVTEKTDRRGVTAVNTYDELNRLTRVEVSGRFGPRQTLAQMDYDKVGNKLFEIDLHGSRTDFGYDGLYRVTSRHLPTGHTETFVYDRVGNKLVERDANGKATELAYDRLNRLVFRKDAEDNRTSFAYDEAGNQTVSTDLTRGLETRMLYDFLNRPLSRVVEGSQPNGFRHETTFEYFDSEHRIVQTDPRDFEKTTFLDGFDRVREVRQETGTEELVSKNFYDANGNLEKSVDAENRETDFRYDGLNRLSETEDALGRITRFEYDGEGNKTSEVERRGVPRTFVYDNLGRLVRTELDQILTGKGRLTLSQIFYSDALLRRQELYARGFPTTFEMDRLGRVTSITDADGKVQRFEYDGVNKIAEVDKKSRRTEFTYDGINRLIEVRDPLGQTIQTDYLDALRRVVEVDKRGIEKTTQLDALGRLVSVTRSGIVLERHDYDGNNNRTLSTDANGNRTQFVYDGANRLIERTDALGAPVETTTRFRYDRVGNLLEEKDGRDTGKAFDVRNTYDPLNRLQITEDGEGNVTRFEYDAEGNRTAQVEPKSPGHRTEFDYGELNEIIEVRMPDGGIYQYDYDPNRNRTRQTDANGNVVSFTYDKLNRVDRMTQDPGGLNLVTDHDYDPNGNEIKLTDPKGQVIEMDYDELNRLKFKKYNLTPADFELFTRTHRIDYGYDGNDNLIRIDETKSSGTDPPVAVSSFKTYDDLDRLTSETDAWGRKLQYGYDPQGNRTLLQDPDQKRTVYGYDELNRLETLTLDAGTAGEQVVRYEYFADGLKQRVTNPNGTVSTYQYDAADRMTDITHTGPTGIVSSYQYTYDPNGNREQQIETNAGRTETTTYDYDEVNRLTSATYPEKTVTYEYDPAGNRIREVTTGAEPSDKTYAYDAINRLLSIDSTVDAEDVAYQYDPNGNTTSKTKNGVTTEFLYDIRDQLGEVRQGPNILGRYGYDYDGRRILKIGNEGRRQYTYDQLSVITEADPANTTVSKYDYGLDQLVRLDNRGEGRSFFHLDVLRSTVSLTDPAGGARQSIFYDAWGNERERIGASTNNFTFTGHEKDEETGLIYAKARFYDPEIGRFLSQDDLLGEAGSPPSLHRYSYVSQNPLVFIDPAGLAQLSQHRIEHVELALGGFKPGEGGSIEKGTITLSTERGTATVPVPTNSPVVTLLKQFDGNVEAAMAYLDSLEKLGADSFTQVVLEPKDFNQTGLVPTDVYRQFIDEVGILAQTESDFLPVLKDVLSGARAGDAVNISEVVLAASFESRRVGGTLLEKAINPDIVIPDPSGKGPPLVIPQNEVDAFLGNFLARNIVSAGALTEPFGVSGLPREDRARVQLAAAMDLAVYAGVLRSVRAAQLGAAEAPLQLGISAGPSVWSEVAARRGILVEGRLARTEYKDWYHVGSEVNGKFDLVDFQKGSNLVSVKTVDTAGRSWMGEMRAHIQDLSTRGATVNGQPANMILDIRVPPGGRLAAESLIEYGEQFGVKVVTKEIR